MLFFKGKMQAAEREGRRDRWLAWHTAALPLMRRFPTRDAFIDPKPQRDVSTPGAATFWALRGVGGEAPAWVIAKFQNPDAGRS